MCYKLCWYNTERAWPSFYSLTILISHFSYLIKAGDTFATISWRIFLAFFFTLLIALGSAWTKLPGVLGSEASSTMAFWTLTLKSKTCEIIKQQNYSMILKHIQQLCCYRTVICYELHITTRAPCRYKQICTLKYHALQMH